jgi:hypothetical protein
LFCFIAKRISDNLAAYRLNIKLLQDLILINKTKKYLENAEIKKILVENLTKQAQNIT